MFWHTLAKLLYVFLFTFAAFRPRLSVSATMYRSFSPLIMVMVTQLLTVSVGVVKNNGIGTLSSIITCNTAQQSSGEKFVLRAYDINDDSY